MLKDLRKLSKNEAALVLNKMLLHSNYKNTDIRFDDRNNDWWIMINLKDRSVFKAYGRGNVDDGITDDLNVEYTPPNGGRIVFILKIKKEEETDLSFFNSINELLAKYGGKGMNFVSSFEDLNIYSGKIEDLKSCQPLEILKISSMKREEWNWLQKFSMFLLRIANKI